MNNISNNDVNTKLTKMVVRYFTGNEKVLELGRISSWGSDIILIYQNNE